METRDQQEQETNSSQIETIKVSDMIEEQSINSGYFYYVNGNGESRKISPETLSNYVASRSTSTGGSLVPDWSQALKINVVGSYITLNSQNDSYYNRNRYIFSSDYETLDFFKINDSAPIYFPEYIKNGNGIFVKANDSCRFQYTDGVIRTYWVVPCIKI